MTASQWFILFGVFKVLGGLAAFIYGMHMMTRSLTAAAGASLRKILSGATKSPVHGVVFGVVVGFLAHSAAATTMLAGFINAGVMTLGQALAPVFGCNLGTSLSSQLMSLHIADYCWIPIGVGFLVKSFVTSPRWDKLGDALFGFGMLFLGMLTIKQGIMPPDNPHGYTSLQDILKPVLEHVQGATVGGRILGVLLGVVLTAILTSSGAMVGLCFALIDAGVFTLESGGFDQVGPIILGACIGTCIVPVMASLSMRITAKRAAWAHVLFNVLNVAIALCLWVPLKALCIKAAPVGDLQRQLANLHTFAMTTAILLILPLTRLFTVLLLRLTPSKEPDPQPSFLEDDLLDKPEQALAAAIRELRRMADLLVDSMIINGRMILEPTRALARRLDGNEEIVNEVRRSMADYLQRLARHRLSRRQTLFLQHIDRCMKDIERIGDHLAHIGDISVARYKESEAIVPEDLFRVWFSLFCTAKRVVRLMAKSFDPDQASFQGTAAAILKARDVYMIQSMDAKAEFVGAARERRMTAVGAYYFSRYIEDLDRLVRRAKSIALAERQPDFWVKQARMERVAPAEDHPYVPPTRVPVEKYLPLLERDDTEDLPDAVETHRVPKVSPHVLPAEDSPDPAAPPPDA
ncbi:MAG: Na/Pi cotransporter family protein [Kiritimatiellae bacterium]|nr:Na/Pi cotransporter family protein [Kiritimatiellia bacterium]